MSKHILAAALVPVLIGCGGTQSGVESRPPASRPPPALEGKRLLATGHADSAIGLLMEALSEDSMNAGVREDLALGRYQRAMKSDSAARRALAVEAYASYRDLEKRGMIDMVVYDRMCELAQSIGDTAGFLHAASGAAERYPYDRQFFNLGSAQLAAERFREVIQSQKEAVERFPESPYQSGYYRLLGQAYIRVDRYQTAQKVLAAGVEQADKALAASVAGGADQATLRRIERDRVAMLQSLQRLYTIYDEQEKLREVELRLKRAGLSQ